MDHNLPGPAVHGISQTRVLEWLPRRHLSPFDFHAMEILVHTLTAFLHSLRNVPESWSGLLWQFNFSLI